MRRPSTESSLKNKDIPRTFFLCAVNMWARTPIPEGRSSILATKTLDTPDFRWVGLEKLTWQDPNGSSREWECAFRTTRRSECDGVAILAFIRYPISRKKDELLLVSQYRPPVAAEVGLFSRLDYCALDSDKIC